MNIGTSKFCTINAVRYIVRLGWFTAFFCAYKLGINTCFNDFLLVQAYSSSCNKNNVQDNINLLFVALKVNILLDNIVWVHVSPKLATKWPDKHKYKHLTRNKNSMKLTVFQINVDVNDWGFNFKVLRLWKRRVIIITRLIHGKR